MDARYRQRRRRTVSKKNAGGGNSQPTRLIAAAVLFLACLLGRVCFPSQTEAYRARLGQLLAGNTDVRAAFLQLGEQLEEGEAALEAVGGWCTAVFAPEEVALDGSASGSSQP